jgi:hypothetical protein
MSPQLLWTIAGLILTVLTLGGVTISSYQSMDASTAKLIASEVGNVATTAKLWSANDSANGTFTGITPTAVQKYIPDLVVSGAPATLQSKAAPGVTINVAPATLNTDVLITVAGMTTSQATAVLASLSGKACTAASVSTTSVSYTCKG